jgi:hypothetical protein
MLDDKQTHRLRMAIARHAFATDAVRIVNTDLGDFAHIAASRQGLFAVAPGRQRLIAHGQFYGLTVSPGTLWLFEACDLPRTRSNHGRLLRIDHTGGRITQTAVALKGIDNGCHQIDLIDGSLVVTDTYNQRLLRYSPDCGTLETITPLPAPDPVTNAGYVHANSLLAVGAQRYLLLHNDSQRTGRSSEIAVFDPAWNRIGTLPLEGQGCHSLALLEDGAILTCGSGTGELTGTDGRTIKVTDRMTRGLSVDHEMVVVGASAILARDVRDAAPGEVIFLDRSYNHIGSTLLPGPVMEVRRIDGQDRSLSSFLAASA